MKTASLVLGSGGARGMAHVGVIRWLEEQGIQIKSISGCSIGALIGGVYATGQMEEFVSFLQNFNRTDVFSMLDFVFSGSGLVGGKTVLKELKHIIGEKHIEDLPIKYTAVAADIAQEKEVWIRKGPIYEAVRASISLPLFFTPFKLNGRYLVDGGILNPTPLEPVKEDETDLTIAVNLGGLAEKAPKKQDTEKSEFQKQFDEFVASIRPLRSKKEEEWDMLYIADQCFNSMQNNIADRKMLENPPDYLINIPRNKCGTLEFERSKELIDYGYQMAEENLLGLKKRS